MHFITVEVEKGEIPDAMKGSFRPGHEILIEHETEHVYVRLIKKPEGVFVGVDGKEILRVKRPPTTGPLYACAGACLGETRAELEAVIAALEKLRDRLP